MFPMTQRTRTLLTRSATITAEDTRRREDLTARAQAAGHSREYADLIYDVAEEEGLDPAVAFEVVLAGVGVRDLGDAPPDNWEETQVEAAPAWIEPPPPAAEAARERHMRITFRRLRRLLEAASSPADALQTFVREPDVGDVEY
jgi:hypothetical protein